MAKDKISKEHEYLDGWKRCMADFENYKKRQAELQKDLVKFSNEGLIMEILPVLDNFHASTDHIPEEQKDSPWVVGIMHIQKQLEKVLENNGVEEIKTEIGDEFDHNIHEAIENNKQPTTDDKQHKLENKISKIVLKGYKMGGKVIRPARVVVK